MGQYQRRCKRILKQYGKNIKAFDYRLDNPKDDTTIKEICKKHNLKYERRVMLSWFARRTQKITCYDDLVKLANGK